MTNLKLAELTPGNVGPAMKMPLKPGQEKFVAPVSVSIAEAYVHPTAWPRVVLDGDEVVGFVMGNFEPDHEIEAFRAGLWRLNVHADAQGRGVGRFAVEQLAAEARARGVGRITVLWVPGEGGPEGFYRKLGFTPTGEVMDGQLVGVLDL
jgi:diamine N-acetyltransferase